MKNENDIYLQFLFKKISDLLKSQILNHHEAKIKSKMLEIDIIFMKFNLLHTCILGSILALTFEILLFCKSPIKSTFGY